MGISIGSSWQTKQRQQLVYTESLDKVAASVNGTKLTLREIAFYVAYEEAEVEKQAFAYDAEHPKKYWGIRLNKTYVYAAARNAVIQMAIHDEVFYEMAMQEEIELTDDGADERVLAGSGGRWEGCASWCAGSRHRRDDAADRLC